MRQAIVNKSKKYFDPETLASLRPFSLRARTLIEGLVAGMHRSPLHGHSIEFAQHREYVPGDDLRQVDWKVFARSDRFFLKQYEDESNLNCYFLLDQSDSMRYRGADSWLSKLEYAQLVVCSLAYLVIGQQDNAGLITFASTIEDWLVAGNSPSRLDDIVDVMENDKGGRRTAIADVMAEVVGRLPRPGIIVLVSDMLDELDPLERAIRQVRFAGHDLLIIQILDADEIQFPFDSMTQFHALEQAEDIATDPLLIAGAYRRAMQDFIERLRNCCMQNGGQFSQLTSDQALSHALSELLSSRWRKGR